MYNGTKVVAARVTRKCPLDALGYVGGWVEVLLNPPGRVLDWLVEGETPWPSEQAAPAVLRAPTDDDLGEEPMATAAPVLDAGEAVTYFNHAVSEILVDTNMANYDFSTPEAALRSRQDNDPQVIVTAMDFFFEQRKMRAAAAKNSFGNLK